MPNRKFRSRWNSPIFQRYEWRNSFRKRKIFMYPAVRSAMLPIIMRTKKEGIELCRIKCWEKLKRNCDSNFVYICCYFYQGFLLSKKKLKEKQREFFNFAIHETFLSSPTLYNVHLTLVEYAKWKNDVKRKKMWKIMTSYCEQIGNKNGLNIKIRVKGVA